MKDSAILLTRPSLPRILPFAVYILFVGGVELLDLFGLVTAGPELSTLLYPVKAGCTALALWFCLPLCPEFRLRDLLSLQHTLVAVVVGMMIFIIWINLDHAWARIGTPVPFMPEAAPEGALRFGLLACRFIGASVVVPLAEELFWRSWLTRAIEAPDFLRIPLGRPHLFSFAAVSILFALEHHLVIAGLIAGIAYTLVLYRSKSVTQCVLAHAVTNAVLGLWVISGGYWTFW